MATDQAESWWLFEWVGPQQVTVRRVSDTTGIEPGSVVMNANDPYWCVERVEDLRRMLEALSA